jgi:hypothetical protein
MPTILVSWTRPAIVPTVSASRGSSLSNSIKRPSAVRPITSRSPRFRRSSPATAIIGATTVSSAPTLSAASRSERFLMILPSPCGESDAGRLLDVTASSLFLAWRFISADREDWPVAAE